MSQKVRVSSYRKYPVSIQLFSVVMFLNIGPNVNKNNKVVIILITDVLGVYYTTGINLRILHILKDLTLHNNCLY